jgi:hypothetical protein
MTIEAEYRQYAQECIESAWAAESEAIRQTFLDIAKLWMMAAARIDSRAGIFSSIGSGRRSRPPERRDGT